MLFNTIEFAIFLPVVFFLYWFVAQRNLRVQNLLVVAASYFFYGWWDWRFLSLLLLSSIVDYAVGIGLASTEATPRRKLLLSLSLFVNLGLLGFFKYYNFFVDSFVDAFPFLGANPSTLNVVLPVGISFYTFQTLSYSIDVYRRKIEPTRDVLAFFAYVSFFPQLVAGPIERASRLLPQFLRERQFDPVEATDGLRQILWGLFKKVVIADQCATYVNSIFAGAGELSGSTLLMGGVLFAFQIYGDFSGYSDIAIGTARLFGIDLMRNFAYPYFSRDIAEFWRRWHISLSSWFREYVYFPLGGSRGGKGMRIRNTFVIFVVSGFWHGANWTFVVWGLLNALYFVPLMLMGSNRANLGIVAGGRALPSPKELLQMLTTFLVTVIAWVFFRAESVTAAVAYLGRMFSASLFSVPTVMPRKLLLLIIVFLWVEWVQRGKQHGLQFDRFPGWVVVRWGIYATLLTLVFLYGGQKQAFIYFQF